MALIGTNGQGVGSSVFQQWSNNCKNNLPTDQLELFEQFVDHAYDAMEQGSFIIIFILMINKFKESGYWAILLIFYNSHQNNLIGGGGLFKSMVEFPYFALVFAHFSSMIRSYFKSITYKVIKK